MYLRWCVVLLSAVTLSYSQDSTGIDAPGSSTPKDSSLSIGLKPDSTAAKTDSSIVNSSTTVSTPASDSTKPGNTLSVPDGSDSQDKCGLQISCFPESASVFITPYKGDLTPYPAYSPSPLSLSNAGLTPFKKWGFEEGYYEISIQKKGWDEFKQVIHLKMGQMTLLEAHLTCKFGYLQVKSEPLGATVILNKVKKGVTPITLIDLKPGLYDLRLEMAKFAPAEMLVSVVKDSKTIVNKKLLTKFEIDSLHSSRLKNFQKFRRYFFAATSIALASAGYYFNTKADRFLDNERQRLDYYRNLGSGTSETAFENAYIRYIRAAEQTNQSLKSRNTLYKASALMAAGFIISIPF